MTPTPDNTKAKVKTKKWKEKLVNKLDAEIMDWFYEAVKMNFDVDIVQDSSELRAILKSFIQSLLDSQRAELLEDIEKWRDKTPDADEYERADRVAWNQCIDEVRDLLTKGTLEQLAIDKGK